ncbi:hypothetical protein ABLE91_05615 [Aquabacter sp. CN5-332]|uniref:hypothetical protein n=1 Tax=Aquabacter sp. CN5-332 TaxID=3156608 RepID=UPI0032B40014
MDEVADGDNGELSLYFATEMGELADLEVAATAAIQWAQGLRAAAAVVDPTCLYRVSLVAAKPGSSNWIAKIERSGPNQAVKRVVEGWKKVPAILRLAMGLAVVIPTTAKPTLDYWLGDDGFTETQKRELRELFEKASGAETVKAHRKAMYQVAPRDKKITAIGTGIPEGENWKPRATIPANQFPEADGLFELEEDKQKERTIPQVLEVVLVTPRLENAPRSWTFRQEGLPGTFNAVMRDKRFLAELDKSGIRERLRANIPMTIRLEIKQQLVGDEWKVARQGRSVVEVISPSVD